MELQRHCGSVRGVSVLAFHRGDYFLGETIGRRLGNILWGPRVVLPSHFSICKH